MSKQITVGIADMKMARQEGVLITYALGSCIGIALYDPMIKLGALVHIMLPEIGRMSNANLYKYADTGVNETLRKMFAFGASKNRLKAKIAGGAKMFEMKGNQDLGNIGQRNALNVKKLLRENGIRLIGEDTGANYARTMLLDVSDGKVTIKTFGRPEKTM